MQIGVLEGLKSFAASKINPKGAANGVFGFNEPLLTSLQPNEMIVPPNVSDGIAQGKLTLGGPGGSGGEYHFHIAQTIPDPAALDKTIRGLIIPGLKNTIINHHGGKIARADGSPVF
jgi:hypothetical protein